MTQTKQPPANPGRFNSTEKFIGLALLSLEVDRLSEAVARELDPYVSIYPNLVPNTLMNAKVY